jgi:hypothetical protein
MGFEAEKPLLYPLSYGIRRDRVVEEPGEPASV